MLGPKQIPLVPLSASKFDSLRDRDDVNTPRGAMPVLGDDFNSPDESYVYAAHCERYNLSDEQDRNEYAELSGKLYAGTEFMRLWEERVVSGTDIVLYVSYIQVLKVRQNGTENFDIEE